MLNLLRPDQKSDKLSSQVKNFFIQKGEIFRNTYVQEIEPALQFILPFLLPKIYLKFLYIQLIHICIEKQVPFKD